MSIQFYSSSSSLSFLIGGGGFFGNSYPSLFSTDLDYNFWLKIKALKYISVVSFILSKILSVGSQVNYKFDLKLDSTSSKS